MASIKAHLNRVLPANWWRCLDDPRRCERSRSFESLIKPVLHGMLSGCGNLRQLERHSNIAGQRVPDTTVWDLLVQMDPEPLKGLIASGVKQAARSHELGGSELPLRLVAIDGKALTRTTKPVDEFSINRSQKGNKKYVQMAIRAVLVSSPLKLHLGQMRYRKTNERGAFAPFLDELIELYGKTDLLQVISIDAGITSIKNAKAIVGKGLDYIMALKDPKNRKATRYAIETFDTRLNPDRVEVERKSGKDIKRSLFRAPVPAHVDWPGAKEIWKLEKSITDAAGVTSVETRYFITSLAKATLTGKQVLMAIRSHWGIENNANWVLDTAWEEDSRPWCRPALELISLFRLLAYNIIARFKLRRFRKAADMPWKYILHLVNDALFRIPPRLDPATL